jgi:hypothetical protein
MQFPALHRNCDKPAILGALPPRVRPEHGNSR